MICRNCGKSLTGETAHIGSPMCASSGYPDVYLLLVSCSCGATHSIKIWQSTESAEEDAAEEVTEAA